MKYEGNMKGIFVKYIFIAHLLLLLSYCASEPRRVDCYIGQSGGAQRMLSFLDITCSPDDTTALYLVFLGASLSL